MVNARIDGIAERQSRLIEKADVAAGRHAELGALVASLTVAVEALEQKVETLVRLELEDAGLIPPLNIHPDPRLLALRDDDPDVRT